MKNNENIFNCLWVIQQNKNRKLIAANLQPFKIQVYGYVTTLMKFEGYLSEVNRKLSFALSNVDVQNIKFPNRAVISIY